jgi:uncharacterized membrane-anchored protein
MKLNARKASPILPGVTGTARVGRTGAVVRRLRRGDVAVLDHVDMDRDTATALVDAGVTAVVNASPMISGRYAHLGPEVLAEAGVLLVDQIGAEGRDRIRDEAPVRVHAGQVYAAAADGSGELLASGRQVDSDMVHIEMAAARSGLLVQLDDLTHSTSDFLRREQQLLVDGRGLPEVGTDLSGRPVVVVAEAKHADLQALRRFVREQAPALIAVGAVADDLIGVSWAPDVVVVTAGDPSSLPSVDALRIARDVVVLAPGGSSRSELAAIETAGVTPYLVDSTASAEDVALLLADRADARLMVGVGLSSRLEDILDPERSVHASTFATRLKVGSRLVDASAVQALYGSRRSPLQLALVLLTGTTALLAAIAVTPVGHEWAVDVVDYFQGLM